MIKLIEVDNGMPKLKVKPSRIFIPQMKANPTREERAKFLMNAYQYTEVICDNLSEFTNVITNTKDTNNKKYNDGLYIIKNPKTKSLDALFLNTHTGYSIVEQDMYYVCTDNGKARKAIPVLGSNGGLFELAVQIKLDTLARWKDSFDIMELTGLSKGILNRYMKDGSFPKRADNIRALNRYLDFIKKEPNIDKEVQARLKAAAEAKELSNPEVKEEVKQPITEYQDIKEILNFKVVDNGMPELLIKPSRNHIPDMETNQTPQERALFLMNRFKYTELSPRYSHIDVDKELGKVTRGIPHGLYIIMNHKREVVKYTFIKDKSGYTMSKIGDKFAVLHNKECIKIFDSVITLYEALYIRGGFIEWHDSFDLYKLLGLSKNDVRKYDKFGRIPKNEQGLNDLLEFRQAKTELKKEVGEHALLEGKMQHNEGIEKLKEITIKNKPRMIKSIRTVGTFTRDRANVEFVLQREKFTCQHDRSHKTFTSGSTKKQYMEVHHLIPMKYQESFNFDLDTPDNMFSLCPTCHMAIHHGDRETIRQIARELYNQRGYKLSLTLEQILKLYYK